MKILMSKIKKKHVITLATIICALVLLQFVPGVKAQTDSGPTIYDSTYIDKLEIEIKSLIQSSNDELKKQITSMPVQTDIEKELSDTQKELATVKNSIVFKIIKLPAGKTLIGDASTEIIVRYSKNIVTAYVSSAATGGISNLISGKDIPNGVIIPANQLLLVPKADGRGITAKADADIMIKGTYTIK